MCRADVNRPFGFCVDPSAEDAPARKHERVRALPVDDRQFKVAIERRGRYGVPIHVDLTRLWKRRHLIASWILGAARVGRQIAYVAVNAWPVAIIP
jgi:hypothetical protein